MTPEQLKRWGVSLVFIAVSISWRPAYGGRTSKADSRQILPCTVNGTYEFSCASQWHQLKLKSEVCGELYLPNTLQQAFVSNPNLSITPLKWSIPEDVACAFARELAESIELRPKDIPGWTQWLGSDPKEQSLIANSKLNCTLGEQLTSDGGNVANVIVTGTVVITTSGRLGSRNGPNWWRENWQAQVNGRICVDMKKQTVTSGFLILEGEVEGSFLQSDGKTGENYSGDLLIRVETLTINPQQNLEIDPLIFELGHQEFAYRKQARERALTLQSQPLKMLIAELRKSTDPELWHAADFLEQSKPAKDSQASNTILWSNKELKGMGKSTP